MKHIWKNLLIAAVLIFLIFQIARLLYPCKYEAYVREAAAESGVSENLIYAMIKAESNFNPSAVSDSGAFGLMQLMPDTAKWICEKKDIPFETASLTVPEKNIRMGSLYLAYLLSMYHGNETNAIAAYNAGHARVDEWLDDAACSQNGETLKKIPFPETEKYVNRVKKYKKMYRILYGETE
ncbi:MAG: transglycosylase SLT domain-containing protein [Clostridia bacterium]|nr:transglycosylase SLT domain-containing protein [Clostridia bacterium]